MYKILTTGIYMRKTTKPKLSKTKISMIIITALLNQSKASANMILENGVQRVNDEFFLQFDSSFYQQYKLVENEQYLHITKANVRKYKQEVNYYSDDFVEEVQKQGLDSNKSHKYFGDSMVESEIITRQLESILSTSILGNKTEEETSKELYNNGLEYTKQHNIKLGHTLKKTANINKNLLHIENIGHNNNLYLTPVVYLTEETIKHNRRGSANLFATENITFETTNDIALENISLNARNNINANTDGKFTANNTNIRSTNISIQAQETALKNNTYTSNQISINSGIIKDSESNFTQQATSGKNNYFNAQAQQDLTLQGSKIESKGNINLSSNANIKIMPSEQEQNKNSIKPYIAQLIAEQNININSKQNIEIQAGDVRANNIKINSEEEKVILSTTKRLINNADEDDSSKHTIVSQNVITTSLQAQEAIDILAAKGIEIKGAEIIANRKNVNLLSKLGIKIINDIKFSSFSSYFFKENKQSWNQQERKKIINSLIKAGKDIKIQSEIGNIVIVSSELNSDKEIYLHSKTGQIHFGMDGENINSVSSGKRKNFWASSSTQNNIQGIKGKYNRIYGNLNVNGVSVNIEYNCIEKDECNGVDIIDKLKEKEEYKWMHDISQQHRVELIKMDYKIKYYNNVDNSLSPHVKAILSLGLTIAESIFNLNINNIFDDIWGLFTDSSVVKMITRTVTMNALKMYMEGKDTKTVIRNLLSNKELINITNDAILLIPIDEFLDSQLETIKDDVNPSTFSILEITKDITVKFAKEYCQEQALSILTKHKWDPSISKEQQINLAFDIAGAAFGKDVMLEIEEAIDTGGEYLQIIDNISQISNICNDTSNTECQQNAETIIKKIFDLVLSKSTSTELQANKEAIEMYYQLAKEIYKQGLNINVIALTIKTYFIKFSEDSNQANQININMDILNNAYEKFKTIQKIINQSNQTN